jgi:hypothetical protein
MRTSLYERLGHTTYVELHDATGVKLPRAIRNAKPAPDHKYVECRKPYACPDHRATYRRVLAAKKKAAEQTALRLKNAAALNLVARSVGH